MEKLNFAILGAGSIAGTMAQTVAQMPQVRLYAVGSRSQGRARAFADAHGFEKAYGSYEELVQDEAVQLVYIATPHSHHAAHAELCIRHGRPVLCEKAFTANAAQARQVLALAREKGVFVTEAIWTRYIPLAATLHRLVAQGALGRPIYLHATHGQKLDHKQRMTDPALAGGALLDLGVYTLTLAGIALGNKVAASSSVVQLYKTGVDASHTLALSYENGAIAALTSSLLAPLPTTQYLYGSEAALEITGINNYTALRLLSPSGEELARYDAPPQISGYEYEVLACIRALEEGRLECPEMPHDETIRVMEWMDGFRAAWGLRYPFE